MALQLPVAAGTPAPIMYITNMVEKSNPSTLYKENYKQSYVITEKKLKPKLLTAIPFQVF